MGGSLNIMQIGKKKQMMYDAAYDRTGKNLGNAFDQLASYSGRLASASLPSWLSAPTLDAPIDAERLRFNTSQKYSINHIKKNKDDAETRIEANYVRQVIRQERENSSIYDFGGDSPVTTTERNHKTMISDACNLQWENKVNKADCYGNENHGVSDLYVNDDRSRIRTNLWHTAHTLEWQKNKYHWSRQYQVSLEANNLNIGYNCLDITGKFAPYWQYQTKTFRASTSRHLGAPSVMRGISSPTTRNAKVQRFHRCSTGSKPSLPLPPSAMWTSLSLWSTIATNCKRAIISTASSATPRQYGA